MTQSTAVSPQPIADLLAEEVGKRPWNVYVYGTVWVKVEDVTGESVAQLLEAADKRAEMDQRFAGKDQSFADEVTGFLLDGLDADGSVDGRLEGVYVDPEGRVSGMTTEAQLRARLEELESYVAGVARLQCEGEVDVDGQWVCIDEIDNPTDDQECDSSLSGDDSVEALSGLIREARDLMKEKG